MTKAIPPALLAQYQSGCTTMCTCWKVTLNDNPNPALRTVMGFTDLDVDILIDGISYLASGGYTPSAVDTSSELNPDNLEIQGFLSMASITEEDLRTGRWDYAAIEIFEVNYNDVSMGKNILRSGTLGEVKAGTVQFTAELRGLMQAYTKTIVRLTAKECDADLGDARCKVNLAAFTFTGTVTSVTSNSDFVVSATQAEDYFTGGTVKFTSGLNAGLGMEVKKSYANGDILTHQLMPYNVAVGDAVTLVAGCTKRAIEDCKGKFNNIVNFRGFPYLPQHDAYQVGKGSNAATTTLTDATYTGTTGTTVTSQNPPA